MAGAVIAMEFVALVVGYLAFGWPVLVVGAPVIVGTALVLLVAHLSEGPRRRLAELRASRREQPRPAQGGLMSGFYELPVQRVTGGTPAWGPAERTGAPRR
ncbi:MAG: hypothetical protein OJJ54_09385 [Pseudonocardia sp.]|nr:hypothetical protein [Pseudonocardia sp.]